MTVVHPTKKEVVSEFRRSGILKAARKVFARHGYDGATMDDVAEACSIAKGTLYLYFKSKRQIYLGVLKEDLRSLREETGRAIQAADSASAKIRAFITARVDFFDRHRDFLRIYNSDISAVFITAHPLQKDIREFYLEQAGVLTEIIAEGIRAGELRDVPAQAAAFAVYDMTRACIARRVLGLAGGLGGGLGHQAGAADAGTLIDLIWRGIARV
jgi:AcrR family transcriptional regulator